jgi:hypothetical protein
MVIKSLEHGVTVDFFFFVFGSLAVCTIIQGWGFFQWESGIYPRVSRLEREREGFCVVWFGF